jgi:hypothetical protein
MKSKFNILFQMQLRLHVPCGSSVDRPPSPPPLLTTVTASSALQQVRSSSRSGSSLSPSIGNSLEASPVALLWSPPRSPPLSPIQPMQPSFLPTSHKLVNTPVDIVTPTPVHPPIQTSALTSTNVSSSSSTIINNHVPSLSKRKRVAVEHEVVKDVRKTSREQPDMNRTTTRLVRGASSITTHIATDTHTANVSNNGINDNDEDDDLRKRRRQRRRGQLISSSSSPSDEITTSSSLSTSHLTSSKSTSSGNIISVSSFLPRSSPLPTPAVSLSSLSVAPQVSASTSSVSSVASSSSSPERGPIVIPDSPSDARHHSYHHHVSYHNQLNNDDDDNQNTTSPVVASSSSATINQNHGSDKSIFSGLGLFLVEDGIGAVRCGVFRANFMKKGGQVMESALTLHCTWHIHCCFHNRS